MVSETVGRTGWDFLHELVDKGLPLIVAVGAVVLFVYMLMHPDKVKEWNVIVSTAVAKFSPKRRKKHSKEGLI